MCGQSDTIIWKKIIVMYWSNVYINVLALLKLMMQGLYIDAQLMRKALYLANVIH